MSILQLNLSQKKAKEVAQLLASETALKVMDELRSGSKSESSLSKNLSIPPSTIHHNIQKLKQAGLVVSDEFTYSEKGKEMRHYKLTSEHVLITTNPLGAAALLTGLGLSLLVTAVLFFWRRTEKAFFETAPMAARDAGEGLMAQRVPEAASQPAIWPYVLLGAGIMLTGILLVLTIQKLIKR